MLLIHTFASSHNAPVADPTVNRVLTREEMYKLTRFAEFLSPETPPQDPKQNDPEPEKAIPNRGIGQLTAPPQIPPPQQQYYHQPMPTPAPAVPYDSTALTRRTLTTIVLLLLVVMAIFSFASYFGPWSFSKRTEVGSSGIVSWSYRWRYNYYLTYYTSATSSNEVLYRTASDWRRECHHDGTWAAILFLTLSLILCIVAFICVVYDRNTTSTRTRRAAMFLTWTICLFYFFALGFWLLGCHDSIKTHTTKTRSTDPSQITNDIQVYWGWGLVLMCWLISIATATLQTMVWQKGRYSYRYSVPPSQSSIELMKMPSVTAQYNYPISSAPGAKAGLAASQHNLNAIQQNIASPPGLYQQPSVVSQPNLYLQQQQVQAQNVYNGRPALYHQQSLQTSTSGPYNGSPGYVPNLHQEQLNVMLRTQGQPVVDKSSAVL